MGVNQIVGSCLCGGVGFEVDRFLPHTTNCHCSQCRKFHGAAYATYGVVEEGALRISKGSELLSSYVGANGVARTFCKICGSSLFFKGSGSSDTVDVALGTLDSDPGLRPEANIYMGSKAPWLVEHGDIPSYDEGHDLP